MSAGPFSSSKYEAGNGDVYPCKVQPETTLLTINGVANSPPTDPTTVRLRATMTSGNRRYGMHARAVTLRWTGTPPSPYSSGGAILRVPCLTKAFYDGLAPDDTGTYLGAAVEVVGLLPERFR